MKKSLVSICIPTYNGAKFIAEAMDSALCQTYEHLEIIVSDDASKDATLEIIEAYKAKTNIPISIYLHEPNGIGANWNHCIKQAKGKYIKFLFQDDVLLPNCIEKMVRVLENDYTVGLVASKRDFIVETPFVSGSTEKFIQEYNDLQKALQLPLKDGLRIIDKSLFKSNLFFKSPLNKVWRTSCCFISESPC